MIGRVFPGAIRELRRLLTALQGMWFDLTRTVKTSGYVSLTSLTLAGTGKSGFDYLPTRPARVREMLSDLPIANHSDYTFVDLGSGKGRVLFLAAEFSFHSIEGIEFAEELHAIALENIRNLRRTKQKCERIRSIHLDVIDYRFPRQNLVIYLFNPFGDAIMRQVFDNLRASLIESPRHVVIALVTPEYADVLDDLTWLTCWRRTPHYRIYQNLP